VLNYTLIDVWWVTFIVLMSLYFVLIPLLIKYLPYFTAQKDLIIWKGER
jgi:hypothetical protein